MNKFEFKNIKIRFGIYFLFILYSMIAFIYGVESPKPDIEISFFLLFILFLFIILIEYFFRKNTLGLYRNNIGRKSIIVFILLYSILIIYFIFDKSISTNLIIKNAFLLFPIFSFVILIRDIIIGNENMEKIEIDRDSVHIKKIHKRYVNWSKNRISNLTYSFKNKIFTNNSFNPIFTYYLILIVNIGYVLVYRMKVPLLSYIGVLLIAQLITVNINEKIRMLKGFIVLLAIFFSSILFTKLFIPEINNPFKQGDLTDPSFSETRIGRDKGVADDLFELLFRVDWKDKKTNLLPVAFYTSFDEKTNNWMLSPELKHLEHLSSTETTVQLIEPEKLKLVDLSEIYKKNYKVNNISYNENKTIKPNYDLKVEKENSLSIIGVLNKDANQRYSLAAPYNSKYIVGSDLELNKFYEYTSGSILISGQTGFKHWTYYYDQYNDNQIKMSDPISRDLEYPKMYEKSVKKLIVDSGVKENDTQKMKVVKLVGYFVSNYEYTLNNKYQNTNTSRNLFQFMNDDKRGHCEYFATILTFALRDLGIPARYNVGFLVSENKSNEGENIYWVRSKDAHAWTSYWNGQAWETADATPYSDDAFNSFGKKSFLSDKLEELKYLINNVDITDYITYIIYFVLFIIIAIYVFKRVKNNSKKSLYYKDKEILKFEKIIKKYEKKYPNENNDLYKTWAYKTNDENLINLVNKFYKRYEK